MKKGNKRTSLEAEMNPPLLQNTGWKNILQTYPV